MPSTRITIKNIETALTMTAILQSEAGPVQAILHIRNHIGSPELA